MLDGQFEERTIRVNRVAKVVKGGRRFSFTALMVVGDGNGRVGLGYGKAKEAGLAVQKGIEEARKNMFDVPLAGATITHPIIGEAGAGRVMLKPASPGTGVIAGGAARAILEMAGIHDILCKSLGSSNGINVAHATIAGLKALRRPDEVAALRGKQADDTLHEKLVEVDDEEELLVLEKKVEDKLDKKRGKKRDDEAQVVKLSEVEPAVLKASKQDGAPLQVIENEKTELSAAPQLAPPLDAPKIVAPVKPKIMAAQAPAKEPAAPKQDYIPAAGGYHLPDLALLDYQESPETVVSQNTDEMYALANKLQTTLSDYGIKGEVKEIHPGPVVTMYEFVPAPGTKLSRISALSNDLAMAMAALKVRIVAPIPGKSSVGIEVPNKKRATVYLKEILADEGVQKAASKLTMGLGKDIAGNPVAVDLAKMPHLLVAGATGAGKSVGLNTMICSILFNANPEEVRMIMIDPKMVELSIYEGIPHLLLPVVTDPKKANLALKWAVDEMERRYEMVAKTGLRDIIAYNKHVEKKLAGGVPKQESKKIRIYVTGDDGCKQEVECSASEQAVHAAGGTVTNEVLNDISAVNAARQKEAEARAAETPPKKLPYIVIIIDEYADLMAVASKEVEMSVARIAQKARAVGIHLILATQRPSVNVVTGLIKANFPSRIAFQVAQKIDSRTILDQMGAENLLGMGDMLLTDKGKALQRVHGALVTDVEIKLLVEFLKKQGQPVYDMDILKPREEEGEGADGLPDDLGSDPEYDKAVRLVTESNNASVSFIQRRLQIGFNRASRLVERMEKEGIVGPANGSKPREVLAQAI